MTELLKQLLRSFVSEYIKMSNFSERTQSTFTKFMQNNIQFSWWYIALLKMNREFNKKLWSKWLKRSVVYILRIFIHYIHHNCVCVVIHLNGNIFYFRFPQRIFYQHIRSVCLYTFAWFKNNEHIPETK